MNSVGNQNPDFGALVISLDFELHWGVRDKCAPDGPYRDNLLGARKAIPRILDLFEEFEVAATWATVGFLFAESRREREAFCPAIRPQYVDTRLDPYAEPTGENEDDDPLHYAASLIAQIVKRPKQEIATHTFSHYYCQEPGETRESFAADLASAVAIAQRRGLNVGSIVFPRNQFRPGYEDLLKEAGVLCYRGNEPHWMYRPRPRSQETLAGRAPRRLYHYVSLSGSKVVRWDEILQPNGLCDVRSSMFLRPYSTQRKSLEQDRKSTRLNSSHHFISYAVFCLQKNPGENSPVAASRRLLTLGLRRKRPPRPLAEGFFFFKGHGPPGISPLSRHAAPPV